MHFTKAVKRDAKVRLALCGAAGSGKTFTLLSLATELVAGTGKRIAFVDTEHGSASKYAHTDTCGGPTECKDASHFDFDVIEPERFDPRELIQGIRDMAEAGYGVGCIDSLSHYWMGAGGELEMVDSAAKRDPRGNSFTAWKSVTPAHNELIDTIIGAKIHVLVSMRTKTEWVIEKDDKGKTVPRKIGLTPIMRDGIEFEFDVCGDMDQDNSLTISKTRCSELAGRTIQRPGKDLASILRRWLQGAPAIISDAQRKHLVTLMTQSGKAPADVKAIIAAHGFGDSSEITAAEYDAICLEITSGTQQPSSEVVTQSGYEAAIAVAANFPVVPKIGGSPAYPRDIHNHEEWPDHLDAGFRQGPEEWVQVDGTFYQWDAANKRYSPRGVAESKATGTRRKL